MLSEEMYTLIKKIPRRGNWVPYAELNPTGDMNIDKLLLEAKYDSYDYINQNGRLLRDSTFSLTEKGQAAIEEYEQALRNQKIVETSLTVSRVAMVAAIGSALAAIISLIKMIC